MREDDRCASYESYAFSGISISVQEWDVAVYTHLLKRIGQKQGWKDYSWQVATQDKIALQQVPASDIGGFSTAHTNIYIYNYIYI